VPCPNCAVGEWDMCQNGRYTEHGIKGLDGFGAERYRLDSDAAVNVDAKLGLHAVLLEPASIVAKAWDHIECIGRRALFEPRSVLITGAGPIGLLAALLGAQRGLKVHVLDHNKEGPKPGLVRDLGGAYHSEALGDLSREADIVIECTGAPAVIFGAIEHARPNGIVCLTGVSSGGQRLPIDVGAINRELVLENNVVFGTVNANRRHYEQGAAALAAADPGWLDRLITRRVPLEKWQEALEKRAGDVKAVMLLESA
jgi:glucose 1-dehydrogenase